jgi:hypothetical protein
VQNELFESKDELSLHGGRSVKFNERLSDRGTLSLTTVAENYTFLTVGRIALSTKKVVYSGIGVVHM